MVLGKRKRIYGPGGPSKRQRPRTAVRKRRMRRRRYRKGPYKKAARSRKNQPFPRNMLVPMKSYITRTIDVDFNPFNVCKQLQGFRLNDCYNPAAATVSVNFQSQFYDNLRAIYRRWKVHSVKVTIQCQLISTENGDGPIDAPIYLYYAALPSSKTDDPFLTSADSPWKWMQRPNIKVRRIYAKEAKPFTLISSYHKIKVMDGEPDLDDQYEGHADGILSDTPSRVLWGRLALGTDDAAAQSGTPAGFSARVSLTVKLTFYTQWSELRTGAGDT